jgi:hypothetical protein
MAAFDFLECERRLQQGLKTSAPCTSVQSPVAVPVDGDDVGTNFASRKKTLRATDGKKEQKKLLPGRHLTSEQREDISTDLQDSITGAVSMTAAASDKEAVGFAGEMASVLEDSGFKVKIDNAKRRSPEQKIPAGVEMTISDETIRPRHAYRIVQAFRRAGVAIATRINARRRKNNTLYITVGSNDASVLVSPIIRTATTWQWRSLAKWKAKFAFGLRRGKK